MKILRTNAQEDVLIKDNTITNDLSLVRVYELLSILNKVIPTIRQADAPPTLAEFCILTYLLQIILNNILHLPKSYTQGLAFRELLYTETGAWTKTDRLSISHVLNLKQFYEDNKNHLIPLIQKDFFQNGLFERIAEHLRAQNFTDVIRDFELSEQIANLQAINQIPANILPSNNQLLNPGNVKDDALKTAIYSYSKLLQEITEQYSFFAGTQRSNFTSLDIQAFFSIVYQILGNSYKLLAWQSAESNSDSEFSQYIISQRNFYAHATKLCSLNYEDFLYYFGHKWAQVKVKLTLTEPKEIQPKVTIELKQDEKFETPEDEYEAPPIQSSIIRPKEATSQQNIEQIRVELKRSDIEVAPSRHVLKAQTYALSQAIIDIIKDAFNNNRCLTSEETEQIKQYIDNPLFDPNLRVCCRYSHKLQKLHEIDDRGYKQQKLVKTLSEEAQSFTTKQRPIDIIAQIPESNETIALIEIMLDYGANPVRRSRELFTLVEYAVIGKNSAILETIIKHIHPDLLPKVLDGTIKGSIEEVGVNTGFYTPFYLSLALLGQEDQATVIAKYEQDLNNRILILGDESHTVVLNTYGMALRFKAFKCIESFFSNLNYSVFRNCIYDDCIGRETDSKGALAPFGLGFFKRSTNIHILYSQADYNTLLNIFIKNGIDICKITTLWTYSPEVIEGMLPLIGYDRGNQANVIFLAKIADATLKYKAYKVLNAIVADKIVSLTELTTAIQELPTDQTSAFPYLTEFYRQYYLPENRPNQAQFDDKGFPMAKDTLDLTTDRALNLNLQEDCFALLQHINAIKSPYLKERLLNFFKAPEHTGLLCLLSNKELIELLPSCLPLINEITTVLVQNNANAAQCSSLVKRIDKITGPVKNLLTEYIAYKADSTENNLETKLYKALHTTLLKTETSSNIAAPVPTTAPLQGLEIKVSDASLSNMLSINLDTSLTGDSTLPD